MASTSNRALTLLSLLSARREWSGADLAGRLGVSTRTVRRDVETLRELGYPVTAGRGPAGRYRLGPGGALPPLLFDEEQAVAVALALQTAPVTVTGTGEGAERALATLRQVLPARLRAQVDDLRSSSIWNPWEFTAPPVDRETLAAVGSAVRAGHLLRLDLLAPDGSRPEVGPPRCVEPHHLTVWAGRWYLVAHDPAVGGWVVHRVDRLVPRSPTGVPFPRRALTPAEADRLVVGCADRGDTPADWPCLGSVVMELPAGTVAPWAPGGSVVEHVTDDRCRVVLGAWSWAGVAGILATFDAPLHEVEPAPLREAMARLAGRLARAAG